MTSPALDSLDVSETKPRFAAAVSREMQISSVKRVLNGFYVDGSIAACHVSHIVCDDLTQRRDAEPRV